MGLRSVRLKPAVAAKILEPMDRQDRRHPVRGVERPEQVGLKERTQW
jgi:hypothetical protein